MGSKKSEKSTRTTREKPVSLHPLDTDDALRLLLATPKPAKDEDCEDEKDRSKKNGHRS